MSGSSEAGTPQPESGAPADASLLDEVPARAVDGSAALPESLPPEAPAPDGRAPEVDHTEGVVADSAVTDAVTPAPVVTPVTEPIAPALDPHAERDVLLSTGARIIVLASALLGALGLW